MCIMSDLTQFNSDLDNYDSDFMALSQIQKKMLARQQMHQLQIEENKGIATYSKKIAEQAIKRVQKLEGEEGYYTVKKLNVLVGDLWKENDEKSEISKKLGKLCTKYGRIRIPIKDSNWGTVWGYDPYIIRIFLESRNIPVPEEILYAQ